MKKARQYASDDRVISIDGIKRTLLPDSTEFINDRRGRHRLRARTRKEDKDTDTSFSFIFCSVLQTQLYQFSGGRGNF